MASRNSLSDDWEDIGDDNLSVISLPGSDTEEESAAESVSPSSPQHVTSASRSPRRSSTGSPNSIPIRPAPRGSPPRYIDTLSDSTTLRGQQEAGQSVRDKGKAPATTEREDTGSSSSSGFIQSQPLADPFQGFQDPPYPDYSDDSDEERLDDSEEEQVDELFDDGSRDANPLFIHRTLMSVREHLDDTAQVVRGTASPILNMLGSSILVCDLISEQLTELVPIVSGYADFFYASSRDCPLDPGLHGWLSGVRVKLLSLQAEAQTLNREPTLHARRIQVLEKIGENLFDYQKKMAEFLPIMQVDFSEFQTRQMNMPTSRPSDAGAIIDSPDRSAPIDIPRPPTPGARCTFFQGPSNNVWLLRHELYALKDLVGQTISKLSNMSLNRSMLAQGSATSRVYEKIFNTLGILLSNHGSDWIESGINGGFTHAEFLEIDPHCVRDLAGQLTALLRSTDELDGWRQPLHLRHEIDDNQQLEELEVIGQVLEAMFTPTRA
ncbi:hypothetical protein B0T22DRAFT_173463 [Podospora appendiculata]|uniref:Uncharacterized protein n=1 Tax=Podospora appendiculata TaxID=314037 RepID=A0AAE0XBH6_9PEZI|nr:hypothetical protein B0T22DRAFT_173463 [Podospora appendiculata]